MRATQEAAERIGAVLAAVGLARLPARVFAALLVDDDGRMTSAELTSFLGVSAAGVSGAIGYLEPIGLVRRERERGGRRDVYVVDDDAWHGTMIRYDQIYAPIKAAIGEAVRLIDGSPAVPRLDLAREFLDFITTEMRSIDERWQIRKKELGLD